MAIPLRNNLYWQIKAQRNQPLCLFAMHAPPRFKAGHKVISFEAYPCNRWCSGYIKRNGLRL